MCILCSMCSFNVDNFVICLPKSNSVCLCQTILLVAVLVNLLSFFSRSLIIKAFLNCFKITFSHKFFSFWFSCWIGFLLSHMYYGALFAVCYKCLQIYLLVTFSPLLQVVWFVFVGFVSFRVAIFPRYDQHQR